MDDLVAALAILANKLNVEVEELSSNFVMYTRVTATIAFVICLVSMYLAYKVLDHVYKKFVENGAFLGYLRVQAKHLPDGDHRKKFKNELIDAIEKDVTGSIKIARTVLMVVIMGAFAFGAVRQIPTLVSPEGAALESVMETLKDATKVEIIQSEARAKRDANVTVTVNKKGND